MKFNISVNADEIAQKIGQTADVISDRLERATKNLSLQARDYIQSKAEEKLNEYQKTQYLEHLYWKEISPGIWVVELDPKVAYLEDGRPARSMATEYWLLKPGKTKTAKDGSKYRAIPFTRSAKPNIAKLSGPEKTLGQMIKAELSHRKLGGNKIIKDDLGNPKLGVVAKLDIPDPGHGFPGLHSRPRSAADAALSGLKPHSGVFYLKNAVLIQREIKRGKKTSIKKEVVVFRTVSSKHFLEGRWMAPEIKGLNAFPDAVDWSKKQLENVIAEIDRELKRIA
jgi:hypothetical protein